MSVSLPLVVGIPGGIELLVVFFILFLLFGVPATLLVALGYKHVRDNARAEEDARLEQLEQEVTELREQIDVGGDTDGLEGDGSGDPTERDPP